ncbi:PaaI family thioesterase [Bradyrhizobium sp. AS23.2]|uniref:PaaI family thioesterase n=1 Tax=Bradyrhizobium sp. AS23.2 TaxID=1680155 RepID=UPI00093F9ECA|nr:PaaI family thioesterase [Bradyrhizobium sp. AS23.2]OKO83062.1 hypothetical protein AC630_12235 [Bradyrhizobium sp. AS23.2]
MTDQQDTASFEQLRTRLSRNHFANWMGLELASAAPGTVEIVAPWREEFISNPDRRYVHGGILATLIDTAGSFAVATRLGRPAQTIDMRVDFHKAATEGRLRVEGAIVKMGRTLATCDARVFDESGALVASGRGVFLVSSA